MKEIRSLYRLKKKLFTENKRMEFEIRHLEHKLKILKLKFNGNKKLINELKTNKSRGRKTK